MGTRSTDDDDDDLLDLPHGASVDDEGTGVADADELLLSELDESPEEIGLDTESIASSEGQVVLDTDDDADTEEGLDDDTPLELEAELDADGDEHGWTEDSEGSSEAWDGDLDDLDETLDSDAGEEGVDDPLLDGLPDSVEAPRTLEDEEDAEDDEDHEDDWLGELPTDLSRDV